MNAASQRGFLYIKEAIYMKFKNTGNDNTALLGLPSGLSWSAYLRYLVKCLEHSECPIKSHYNNDIINNDNNNSRM